jgi:hypothetical protein
MQPDKKKDALTDLVGVAGSSDNAQSDKPLKDGEAVTPSGQVVTMDFTKLAKKLLDTVRGNKGDKT